MSQKNWKTRNLNRFLLWIFITFISVLFLLPVVWMILSSITPNNVVIKYPPKWIPEHPTLMNYINVFTTTETTPVGRALINSVIVTFPSVILTLLVSSLAAYPLARMRFKGKKFLLLLILMGLMIPLQVSFISLFLIFNSVGWLNTYQALILPAVISPFGVFLLRQFFISIPGELEDSAMMDGCSRFKILFVIIMPLSVPALSSLAIFVFLGSWNSFLWPLIVLQTPERYTLPVGLSMMRSEVGTDWPMVMAGALLAALPIVLLFLVLQQWLWRGVGLMHDEG